jgi:hypothetical protein
MAAHRVDHRGSEIIIQQHFEPLTRVLGTPFLAGGLYTFHFIPVAVYKYAVAGQLLGLLRYFPGLVFGVILSLAFASPGIVLTIMGKRVIIDRTANEVVKILDFFVWKWRRSSPLTRYQTVALRCEIVRSDPSKSRRTATRLHTVVLRSEDDATVLLAIVDDNEEGVRLGRQMSAELGLPFVDESRGPAHAPDGASGV